MVVIEDTTPIAAPIERCFSLSLNLDLEIEAVRDFGLVAIGGIRSGTIGYGERVQWKTRQFGIAVTHTSEITHYEAPTYFRDTMIEGIFRNFEHDHFFVAVGANRTEMKDRMRFSLPSYLLGPVTERVLVKRRMRRLLDARNRLIKVRAEGVGCVDVGGASSET